MKLKVFAGQAIELSPTDGVAGRYNIIRQRTLESHHDEPRYWIKGKRVVSESSLNEHVGTPHQYELAALNLKALRQGR